MKIEILVEGNSDKIILEYLFQAAKLPIERISIIPLMGKNKIREYIKTLNPNKFQKTIALIDSDKISIPDSMKEAKEQLGNPPIEVFASVPEIEAWLFADKDLMIRNLKNKSSALLIERISFPEEIPYPRKLYQELFSKDFTFLNEIDISLLIQKSPSFNNFFSAIYRKLKTRKDKRKNINKIISNTIDKKIMVNLIKEVSPFSSIIYRSIDNSEYTAKELIKLIEEGNEVGLEYISDILRVARDYIKALAQSGKRV